MSGVRRFALCVAGLLAVHATIALAQPGGGVQGFVVDEQGQPIGDATILVNSVRADETAEVLTTSDGQFSYSAIAAGLYTITATKDELGSEVFRIRVRDGQTVSVNFELAPGQRVAAYLVEAGERQALSRMFAAGIEASRSGDHEIAVSEFLSALELSPTCLECNYNLAIAYAELDRYADAEVAFQRVLRLRPDYAAAHYGLSSIYMQQGREADAADARSEANRLALERVAVGRAQAGDALSRGLTFFNAGNVVDAVGRFEAAVALDPTLALAHYWLGVSQQQSGQDAAARSSLQRYLQLASSGEFAPEARQRLEDLGP